MRRFANIQYFSSQRKGAKTISTNDAQTGDGQRFGRIAFRQYHSAKMRIFRSRVVGVVQFRQTFQFRMFRRVALFMQLRLKIKFRLVKSKFSVRKFFFRNCIPGLFLSTNPRRFRPPRIWPLVE